MKRVEVWIQRVANSPHLKLQWHDPATGDRRTKSANTADPDAAEKKRADLEYELNHGLHHEPDATPWETFVERYDAEELAAKSIATREKGNQVLAAFGLHAHPKTIGDVTERNVSTYVASLRKQGRATSTIAGYLAYIKAALRWGQTQKFLREVPTIDVPKIPKGVSRAKIRAAGRLAEADLSRLLAACPSDCWRLAAAFAWHCGLRRCEALNVRGEHVDLANHLLLIPANKAGDEDATAVIPPELDAELRRRYPDGCTDGALITDVPADPRKASNVFRREIARRGKVKGSGLDGLCTLHDLRRNYGSRWAAKVPAQVLQRMMRHANIATTMDYYADAERAAVNAVWPDRKTA